MRFDGRSTFGVVPAKAGTHTPQQELLREIGVGNLRKAKIGGYAGLRRDDGGI